MDSTGKWSMTNIKRFYVDQDPDYPLVPVVAQLVEAEYFFDQLQPFGSGTPIILNPASDISNLSLSLNTASFCGDGLHRLYIRTKDATGKWSMTNPDSFEIVSTGILPLTNIFSIRIRALNCRVMVRLFRLPLPIRYLRSIPLFKYPLGYLRVFIHSLPEQKMTLVFGASLNDNLFTSCLYRPD
jgi:hypothetical protein